MPRAHSRSTWLFIRSASMAGCFPRRGIRVILPVSAVLSASPRGEPAVSDDVSRLRGACEADLFCRCMPWKNSLFGRRAKPAVSDDVSRLRGACEADLFLQVRAVG